jgi:GGDEF domain-containing protein
VIFSPVAVPDDRRPAAADGNIPTDGVSFHCTIDDLPRMEAQFGGPIAQDVAAEIDRRLRRVVRGADTSSHTGGGTFVVRCRGVDRSRAPLVAGRLTKTIESPMTIAGINLALSVTLTSRFADDPDARSNVVPEHRAAPPPSRAPGDKRDKLRGVLFSGPGEVP